MSKNKLGEITTFYSFKGGVGRTMALANVAFLAATNGYRVLVMDWDLEAPGLAYYFRGLLEAPDVRGLKDQPGVLNILWEWISSLSEDLDADEFGLLKARYHAGEPFTSCVRSLLDSPMLGLDGCIDFIGAGSRLIKTPDELPYEEALARLSLTDFFEKQAGGFVLDSLRHWAKANYDYVFIDSRTGLADVAGICTMQIPDRVALCFIMNRQNIDGVAKVAAAIRAKRKEEVSLRAVPMRLTGKGTSEGSDAEAKAISELTKIGGFSLSEVQEDMKSLVVSAADNVPFYETLAPFAAEDPSLDFLTLNYLRVASQLLGKELINQKLSPEWVEKVKRRLQPKQATVEYITRLMTAEPTRSVTELHRLIESATEAEADGQEPDQEYVTALIDAVHVAVDLIDDPMDGISLYDRAINLIRELSRSKPFLWRPTLNLEVERFLEKFSFIIEVEDELALLEELDVLLAETPTLSSKVKRITYRRKAAKLFLSSPIDSNLEAASQSVGEFLSIARDLSKEKGLPTEVLSEIFRAEVDGAILIGDISARNEKKEAAYKEYLRGLAKIREHTTSEQDIEVKRFLFSLYQRLSDIGLPYIALNESAEFAIEAIKVGQGYINIPLYFTRLAEVVIAAKEHPELTIQFCEHAFGGEDQRSALQYGSYFGRQPRLAQRFIGIATSLISQIINANHEATDRLIISIIEVIGLILRNLDRRRQTIGDRQRAEFDDQIKQLTAILRLSNMNPGIETLLSRYAASLTTRPRRGDLFE